MNTKLLLGLIVGVIVVGSGYYLLTRDSSQSYENVTNNSESASNRFATLVQSGQSYECTFEYNDEENSSSGIVYMTAGAERIRGDFNITQSAAGPMEVHMIRDGGYNYLWGSAMPGGIKTAVSNEEMLFEGEEGSPVDENTDYECRPWNVDQSKFVLPNNVEFQDMTAFQTNAGASMGAQGMSGASADKCQACEMIADESMAASCKAALSCQ